MNYRYKKLLNKQNENFSLGNFQLKIKNKSNSVIDSHTYEEILSWLNPDRESTEEKFDEILDQQYDIVKIDKQEFVNGLTNLIGNNL